MGDKAWTAEDRSAALDIGAAVLGLNVRLAGGDDAESQARREQIQFAGQVLLKAKAMLDSGEVVTASNPPSSAVGKLLEFVMSAERPEAVADTTFSGPAEGDPDCGVVDPT